ncbi:17025_t:CDS:1, partial [Cetraspora pellucida]
MSQMMVSVCITTDLWTQNHIPYISITAHWLSENFTMYQSLITIEHFTYSHIGDQIEDFLRKILAEWNLFDKVKAVITDNASSMIKAIRQLGATHLGCTAHTIHLAVIDG